MAVKKCSECGEKVSSTAKTCPHCGAKGPAKKRQETSTAIGCVVLLALVLGPCIYFSSSGGGGGGGSSRSAPSVPKTKEESRKEQIERQFSAWDGSHRGLTKLIKASMNDPDSYDHVETVYWDKGDHLVVKTTFRGKNAFGGVVKNWVMAKIDLEGNVIEVISQGP
jgi:DNA-directed RNA polymerase subunit RPC12/RpoP